MISYCLNPNIAVNLCAVVILQSIIILIANSLYIKMLLGCVFALSTSPYLCFL